MFAFTAVSVGLLLMGIEADTIGLSAGSVVTVTAMATAMAAGGSVNLSVQRSGAEAAAVLSFMPLAAAIIGFSVVAFVFVRRLRSPGTRTMTDLLLQGFRIWAIFVVGLLILSTFGRIQENVGDSGMATLLSATTAIGSTFFAGSFWLLLTLCIAVAWYLPAALPPRLRTWRDSVAGPMAGTASSVLFFAGLTLIAVLITITVFGPGSEGDLPFAPDPPVTIGTILLFAPAALIACFVLAMGVPLHVNYSLPNLPGSDYSLTLLSLTDDNSRFWLLPVLALLAVTCGGIVSALHSPTPVRARSTSWRTGAVTAVAVIAILMVTKIYIQGESDDGVKILTDLRFDYLIAPVFGFLWGTFGAWVGAVLTSRLPQSFTARMRVRIERKQSWRRRDPEDQPMKDETASPAWQTSQTGKPDSAAPSPPDVQSQPIYHHRDRS